MHKLDIYDIFNALSSLEKKGKKNADKSINPVKKFEKVSMPNLISAQHMRPVRELLKK